MHGRLNVLPRAWTKNLQSLTDVLLKASSRLPYCRQETTLRARWSPSQDSE
jgi:hypothetical protein